MDQNLKKMIICEHVIVQSVILLFLPVKFEQIIPNKPNQDRLYKLRKISGTFQETIEQGICQKKSQQRARD